jgi:hypothetical protein
MESRFDMKIIKLKPRSGTTMIEMMMVLIIALFSITLIKPLSSHSHDFIMDAYIFSQMMKSISVHEPMPIAFKGHYLNTYHPTHAFSHSYTKHIEGSDIIFYIGRGYYAIKKRS